MAFLKITRRIRTSVILALLGVFAYFSYTRPIYRIFFLYIILNLNSPPIETVLGFFKYGKLINRNIKIVFYLLLTFRGDIIPKE